MPETEAQRKARERNLRKGNPKSYSRPADADAGGAEGEPPKDPPAEPARPRRRTYRASSEPAKPKPAARKRAPRAPARSDPPPAEPRSGGGLLAGLREAFR